jgi:hypothetical protein
MSELDDMTCAEMDDVAAELALGVLTGRERALAVAHLNDCDACRESVRQLMATGEQLLELLPPAEPPAGFESRVLERLGLPASALGAAEPRLIQRPAQAPRRRRPAGGGTRPATERTDGDRPDSDRPGAGPARPKRSKRLRRALAAVAVGLAVIVAGVGGWRIGAGTSPAASTAAGPLSTATLLSATHQDVGDVYLYSSGGRWMYMSVYLGSGDGRVKCQVISTNGDVTTVGSFRLTNGYGGWGTPAPTAAGTLKGAQLVSASGTVLASASFGDW